MKKLIVLSSLITIATVGVAFTKISKSTQQKTHTELKSKVAVKTLHVSDISAKEHTGWD